MMIGAEALDTCGHTHDKDQYGVGHLARETGMSLLAKAFFIG